MEFFKKLLKKDNSVDNKKVTKTKKFIIDVLTNSKYDDIRSLIPSLNKENESVLSGYDEAIEELLLTEKYSKNISDFYLYLLNSKSPTLFKLYYESLLFNPNLYHLLMNEQGFESENHFEHYLLFNADDFEDKEAKSYALGVLSMLKDSFYMKDEIGKNLPDEI